MGLGISQRDQLIEIPRFQRFGASFAYWPTLNSTALPTGIPRILRAFVEGVKEQFQTRAKGRKISDAGQAYHLRE